MKEYVYIQKQSIEKIRIFSMVNKPKRGGKRKGAGRKPEGKSPYTVTLTEENVAGHWIFGLGARHVRDVMVAGEWSVLDRRLARVDAAELTARCREAARRLWERLDEVPEHPFVPEGGS